MSSVTSSPSSLLSSHTAIQGWSSSDTSWKRAWELTEEEEVVEEQMVKADGRTADVAREAKVVMDSSRPKMTPPL